MAEKFSNYVESKFQFFKHLVLQKLISRKNSNHISNFADTENATTEVTEKDVESFENLFAKLVNFKETAAGLPDEERKKFAEQVALSFYSALGEESDED